MVSPGKIGLSPALPAARALVRRSSELFIASALGSVFSYLYLLLAGRALGAEKFGIFGSLFGIFYIFSLLGDALRISIASKLAAMRTIYGNSRAIRGLVKPISILAGIEFLFILAIFFGAGRIALFFHLGNTTPILILDTALLTTLVLFVIMGLIQGLQLFRWLALTGYIIPQALKLFFAWLFIMLGLGMNGFLGALAFSNLIAIAVGILPVARMAKSSPMDETQAIESPSFFHLALPVVLIGIVICVPTSVDVMQVTHFFDPRSAGIYNAVATMGKVVLFAPIAVSLVMLPWVSGKHTQGEKTTQIISLSLLCALILSGAVVVLYWILGKELIQIFFGDGYREAASLMVWYGAAMIFFTCNYLFAQYYLATRNNWSLIVAIALTILELVAISALHQSLLQVIQILLIVNLTLLITNLVFLAVQSKRAEMRRQVIG